MKVMNGRGSLTASGVAAGGGAGAAAGLASLAAAGADDRRRRLRLAGLGASDDDEGDGEMASSVALAMASAVGSPRVDAAAAAALRLRARSASRVATRLFGPRTGVRGVKIQPTPGTGLPPTSRPSSNSHPYSPWNSWNESFDRTSALMRSAMRSRNPSPRPMAPAGGETISPASSASSYILRSDSSIR